MKLTVRRRRIVIRNLQIEQLTPDKLHGNWEFLKRGAGDILAKIAPHSDWVPEDLYAALRYPESSHMVCWLVSRNSKALGWACGELQRTRYGKLEFFLWDAWTLPLRERTPEDDVAGARDQLIEFMRVWAKNQGCFRISTLSARRLDALGWIRGHTVFYLPLG